MNILIRLNLPLFHILHSFHLIRLHLLPQPRILPFLTRLLLSLPILAHPLRPYDTLGCLPELIFIFPLIPEHSLERCPILILFVGRSKFEFVYIIDLFSRLLL